MTFKPLKTLAASLVIATLATASITAPATAGGSFSFSIIAADGTEEADALRVGMAFYQIANALQGGANVTQNGNNNAAGLAQNGWGNQGIVHQEGDGHTGTIAQNGNDNAYGLFQFGKNTNSHVVQNANGSTGTTFQFGW